MHNNVPNMYEVHSESSYSKSNYYNHNKHPSSNIQFQPLHLNLYKNILQLFWIIRIYSEISQSNNSNERAVGEPTSLSFQR